MIHGVWMFGNSFVEMVVPAWMREVDVILLLQFCLATHHLSTGRVLFGSIL
jgi:hypothetical protein